MRNWGACIATAPISDGYKGDMSKSAVSVLLKRGTTLHEDMEETREEPIGPQLASLLILFVQTIKRSFRDFKCSQYTAH
jgi:hypothetical protein